MKNSLNSEKIKRNSAFLLLYPKLHVIQSAYVSKFSKHCLGAFKNITVM